MLTLVPFQRPPGPAWSTFSWNASPSATCRPAAIWWAPTDTLHAAGPPVIALSPGPANGPDHLNGADLEARSLQRLIPRSQLLAQGEATGKNLKALRSPALLHIVGHGLVRSNQDLWPRMRPGSAWIPAPAL